MGYSLEKADKEMESAMVGLLLMKECDSNWNPLGWMRK